MLIGMRTTVNLHDEALELCRKRAQERGLSLGQVIDEAVFAAYGERPSSEGKKRYHLPTSGSGGVWPGVDLTCSAALEDFLDGRE